MSKRISLKLTNQNKMEELEKLTKELALHNVSCSCDKPYIIEKPKGRIERTSIWSKKFFSQKCWTCLSCKWESEIITTRTT